MKLSLFNTLTKKREIFSPIDPNLVKMYVCGPTVYDHPHTGNARSVVTYDVLYRILINIYGKQHVIYVRNITDIDDKIINKALQNKIPISRLTEETIRLFHEDINYLGCLTPNVEPRATEHIPEMINIIQKLVELGFAYLANNHVYFDVKKVQNYTKLSGRTLDEMLVGARVEIDLSKKHPADFVLWKPASEDDDISTKFESPFGVGRPGWHIECSAMSRKYLGETFDIHGGGIDLIFPHHTNEIAQSTCAYPNSEFARLWIHNGFLTVNHEKMSKSLGNFITVKNLVDNGVKGDSVRLFLLSNHYRKPLDYNDKAIKDADKMISYWYRAIENLSELKISNNIELPSEFIEALLDDLNTPMAIKLINDYAKEVHSHINKEQKLQLAIKMYACANFLGFMQSSIVNWSKTLKEDTKQIEALIEQRSIAKKGKNWEIADQIRDTLIKMGIKLEDKTDGLTAWTKIG